MIDHGHGFKPGDEPRPTDRLRAEPWIAELDFATLEKYPTEFIGDRLRQRRNDIIWWLR